MKKITGYLVPTGSKPRLREVYSASFTLKMGTDSPLEIRLRLLRHCLIRTSVWTRLTYRLLKPTEPRLVNCSPELEVVVVVVMDSSTIRFFGGQSSTKQVSLSDNRKKLIRVNKQSQSALNKDFSELINYTFRHRVKGNFSR